MLAFLLGDNRMQSNAEEMITDIDLFLQQIIFTEHTIVKHPESDNSIETAMDDLHYINMIWCTTKKRRHFLKTKDPRMLAATLIAGIELAYIDRFEIWNHKQLY
jgi:hypothetical protein